MHAVTFGLAGLLLTLVGAGASMLAATRSRIRHLEADRTAAVKRSRDLGRAVEQSRRTRVLEGELVVVNTPKPDDQSFRGVVRSELENGLLVLSGAVYIDREVSRGTEVAREVPAGDVVVAGPKLGSWVQVLYAAEAAT